MTGEWFVARKTAASLGQDFLKGSTLVLPTPSVGNVGQFALDLLISTLKEGFQLVGYIDDENVVPFVCADPFQRTAKDTGLLSVNLEVYYNPTKKVTVLQQRAPIRKNKNATFVKSLVRWIKDSGFSSVVVLSSVDAAYRIDSQMEGSQHRFLTLRTRFPALFDQLSSVAHWIPLEEHYPEQLEVIVRKGSYLQRLLSELETSTPELPFATLIGFCSEGDNIPDAVNMVSTLDQHLQLVGSPASPLSAEANHRWVFPPSWRSLFGASVRMYPTIF